MDLGLDLKSFKGRPARPVECEIVRHLTEADLAHPGLDAEKGTRPVLIKNLRDSHHALARCLATGMSAHEASIYTGYTPSRISILKADPTFIELLEFYRTAPDAPIADLAQRHATIALTSAQLMLERLEGGPDGTEAPSESFILDAAKFAADRTGHGPQTKNTNLNVNINLAERLAKGRARAELGGSGVGPQAFTLPPAGSPVHVAPRTIEGKVEGGKVIIPTSDKP